MHLKACWAAARFVYFWRRPCPSCVRLFGIGRQVKGVWWQNTLRVAYFPGFDLPSTCCCEENEDELERRCCPLENERKKKGPNVFKYFSYFQVFVSFSSFHGLFFPLSSAVMECWRSTWSSRSNSTQIRLFFNLRRVETQKNGAKWITVNAEQEKIFTLTSTAPAKMVPESLGHQGSVNSSSYKHSCSQSQHFHHLLLFLCSVSRSGQTGGNPEMLSK